MKMPHDDKFIVKIGGLECAVLAKQCENNRRLRSYDTIYYI